MRQHPQPKKKNAFFKKCYCVHHLLHFIFTTHTQYIYVYAYIYTVFFEEEPKVATLSFGASATLVVGSWLQGASSELVEASSLVALDAACKLFVLNSGADTDPL
jgi:hypothetical protein